MRRPFTAGAVLDEAHSIVSSAAARAQVESRRTTLPAASVLVGIEGNCSCRVRDTFTGRTNVYPVSPRVFEALKRARGRVTVFVQDEKIVGFVI
jgi:hypothetical protein